MPFESSMSMSMFGISDLLEVSIITYFVWELSLGIMKFVSLLFGETRPLSVSLPKLWLAS